MLEKIIKKDINKELEKILEEKEVEEQAKNLLQSILYKIDVSYKDYQKAKAVVKTEKQYEEELLKSIQKKCKAIKIIKLSEKLEEQEIQEELEKNKFYINDNNIISYPIEKKILYAIDKNTNNKKIVNNKYGEIAVPLSNLINTGKNIDKVEVFRDFNGWSWTTVKKEIENIRANLIYQTMQILLGEEFLSDWAKDQDGIIDYVSLMKEILQEKYGEEVSNKIYDSLGKIAIINEMLENTEYKNSIKEKLENLEKQIKEMSNTQEKIKQITEEKKEAEKQLNKYEKIINNEKSLKKEYEKRNAGVELKDKIFSVRILKQMLKEEKEQILTQIEEYNYYLNPLNYIEEKNKLEKAKQLLEVVNYDENEIKEYIIEFEKIFLKCFEKEIKENMEKEEIIKIIYQFRYFMLIPFDKEKNIKEITELSEEISKVEEKIVKTAIEKKVIVNMPIEIMQHVFRTRIILLEELYFKITKKEEKYYVQIFDENISEEKFKIEFIDKIKIDKKIKIFN